MQVTLESEFGDQSKYLKVVCDFSLDMKYKRCSSCGEKKKITEFADSKNTKDGKQSSCIICRIRGNKAMQSYRSKNKEKVRRAGRTHYQKEKNRITHHEWNFLYLKRRPTMCRFLYGTGFCILCDYLDPRGFENHHVIPHVDDEDDFIITLCASCHKIYRGGPSQEKHTKNVQNAIEKSKRLWKDFEEADRCQR